ncbi:hypothetical protein AB0D04_22490 [Streptomyces sp. NPDC048483]|uniref:hypothetical protein n=1 Tax=Streptomyces sp. NPDC048483 TaxID=3154927 RepID=UPI00344354C7
MTEGLGALAGGAMGGQLYAVTADHQGRGTPVFWLVLAAQSAALAAGAALASRRASIPGTG